MEKAGLMLTLKERLHDAATEGNAGVFKRILLEDPLFLRRIEVGSLNHTPLHVASFHGHLDIVEIVLAENYALADVIDSRGWSALHLASAQGHLIVVSNLVGCNAEMCLTRDGGGKNPLHLASVRGQVDVLKWLIEFCPFPQYQLLTAKEGHGNTVLHLAVQSRQFETVKLLLNIIKRWGKREMALKVLNIVNDSGYTALDIVHESYRLFKDHEDIMELFREVGSSTGEEVRRKEELLRRRDSWMVVASLLATMAFQVAVNPPGGSWQDDKSGIPQHRSGESIWAAHSVFQYRNFLWVNALGFTASVTAILMLAFAWHVHSKVREFVFYLVMGFSLFSIAFAYRCSIQAVTPEYYKTRTFINVVTLSCVLTCLLIIDFLFDKAPTRLQIKSLFLQLITRPRNSWTRLGN